MVTPFVVPLWNNICLHRSGLLNPMPLNGGGTPPFRCSSCPNCAAGPFRYRPTASPRATRAGSAASRSLPAVGDPQQGAQRLVLGGVNPVRDIAVGKGTVHQLAGCRDHCQRRLQHAGRVAGDKPVVGLPGTLQPSPVFARASTPTTDLAGHRPDPPALRGGRPHFRNRQNSSRSSSSVARPARRSRR